MKKTLRLAALAAVMSLTFWMAKVNEAQALPLYGSSPPCSVLQGGSCTGGAVWCSLMRDGYPDGYCVCVNGKRDCGCNTYAECY